MYKAFLLILAFLVGTVVIAGQERAPQPRPLSPEAQRIFDYIRAMTPEQRVLLREATLLWLEKRRASEQRTIRIPDQNPLTPFATMSQLGSLLSITEDPNLRKYGPLGPDVKYGPLGPIGDGQSVQQSANALGKVVNLPPGVTHPLDSVFTQLQDGIKNTQDGIKNIQTGINKSLGDINGVIGALNQVQQQIAASNQPPVPRPVDRKLTRPRLASGGSFRSTGPAPVDNTPSNIATAARAGGGNFANPYNRPLQDSKHKIGNRAVNPVTDHTLFGIKPGTLLYDSRGKSRGAIDLSRPGRKHPKKTQLSYGGERMIKLPSGELKRAYDAFGVYLTNGELASGLILEEDLNVKPRMPSLMGPEPPDKGETKYAMTGGNTNVAPWKLNGVTLKVNSNVTHPGENSTDYGLRNGSHVNLCYSVPGTVRGGGGQCYDTFKVGTTFHREKSVHSRTVKLYKPGEDVPVPNAVLRFLYGYVDTPTGKRYGWVPFEALTAK